MVMNWWLKAVLAYQSLALGIAIFSKSTTHEHLP
jgi:hypothetical protein